MKKRSAMTDYEKAVDWRDRLSPRWWTFVFVLYGVSIFGFVLGAALNLAGV